MDDGSMRILNAAQMREADRRTIEEIGIPSIVLMENAGRRVVMAIDTAFADTDWRRAAILCGRGNNGGDGFVVARVLHQRGVEVGVFLLGRSTDVGGDAQINLRVLRQLGMTVVEIPDAEAWRLHRPEVTGSDLVVDGVIGTGLTKPLEGLVRTVVADINESDVPVVSIDLPTGMSAETPELIGESVQAELTVTLGAPKVPLLLPPGASRAGDLVIADIGIPTTVIDALDGPRLEVITRVSLRPTIPARATGAHKGDFGRVLLVAGSTGKAGAARLAGLGALRSGAGLVTVATPVSCLGAVAAVPEYMTHPLTETATGTVDGPAVADVVRFPCDALAVGPGLGIGPGPQAFVHALVEQATVPLVLDADALNAFAGDPDRLRGRDGMSVIITPHPGEMARLAKTTPTNVQANRIETARAFAVDHHVYVVLKGSRTVVATPSGSVFINLTGNPGMATGGAGDVLTGVIAAWLGQLRDTEAACKLAVHLHGLAGDLAARTLGETALTATDIAAHLGSAVNELTRPEVDRLDISR